MPYLVETPLTRPLITLTPLSFWNQWLSMPWTLLLLVTSNLPPPLALSYFTVFPTLWMDPPFVPALPSRTGPSTMGTFTLEIACMFHLPHAHLCSTLSMTPPSRVTLAASIPRPLLNVIFGGQVSQFLSPNLSLAALHANKTTSSRIQLCCH